MPISPSILSVRMTMNERALLESAAEQSRTSLSDFVRRKALEAAEADRLDRRIVTIPTEAWEKVEFWAAQPAKEIPALKKLSASRPVWDGQ